MVIGSVSIVLISIVSTLVLLILPNIDPIPYLQAAPTADIFSQSLRILLNIISVIFVIVIFLIQTTNSEYSSRLSRVIYYDRYAQLTLFFVLLLSIYDLFGIYFALGSPYEGIGFVATLASIGMVIALIAFAGYFLDPANVVEYFGAGIPKRLADFADEMDRIQRDTNLYDEIVEGIHLIVSTCRAAVENDQREVVNTGLDSLDSIATSYVQNYPPRPTTDPLLSEFNNQFDFLIQAILDEYHQQQYLRPVTETVGTITVKIINSGTTNPNWTPWTAQLEKIFTQTINLERTTVHQAVIEELDTAGKAVLRNSDLNGHGVINEHFAEIAAACVEKGNLYFARKFGSIVQSFVSHYLLILHLGVLDELRIDEGEIQLLFEDLKSPLYAAKNSYSIRGRRMVFSVLFGRTNSFALQLRMTLRNLNASSIGAQVEYILILEYINFIDNLSLSIPERNSPRIYFGYPQLLHVIAAELTAPPYISDRLIDELLDGWFSVVKLHYITYDENSGYSGSEFNKAFEAFVALLIHHNQADDQIHEYVGQNLVDIYLDLHDRGVSDQVLSSLYKRMKLYGCWMDIYFSLQDVSPRLFRLLCVEFQEVDIPGRAGPNSMLEAHGYPSRLASSYDSGWSIEGDNVWDGDAIERTVNSAGTAKYKQFHVLIRTHHNLVSGYQRAKIFERALDL